MKDINFKDYQKKNKQNSKYDTAKIPISQYEREIIEARKAQQQTPKRIHQNHTEQNENNKHRHGCSSIITSFVLIFAILFGGIFGYTFSLCSKTNYEPAKTGLLFNADKFTNLKANVYNILLIGTDKEENGASRSDTMILVTIDKNDKKIKFTSFMRDLWVEIPGHESGRLNSAFTVGGPELLMTTISENFDIYIDNYLLVDFEMFQKLIDSLGGISVDITQKEAEFINKTTHATVEPGINTLNGDYALIYCRIRKLDSDFMRTQRQRKVMNAIVDKIKSQNIFTTVSSASDILPLITTDMNAFLMTYKIFSSVSAITYSTDQIRIPADGAYKNKTINGQAVLVPDTEQNINIIKDFIY